MADHSEFIEIDGHQVPAEQADLFFHYDGRRLTDEEWDSAKAARTDANGDNINFVPEEHR